LLDAGYSLLDTGYSLLACLPGVAEGEAWSNVEWKRHKGTKAEEGPVLRSAGE